MVGDGVEQERLRSVVENRVEGGKEAGGGTPVAGQGETLVFSNVCSGFQVGKDVGTPETVDRLLRVADEEERSIRVGIDLPEDIVLDRVGILEFVDQGRPILAPEAGGESCRRSPPQSAL